MLAKPCCGNASAGEAGVREAQEKLLATLAQAGDGTTRSVDLAQASGRVLAADVVAGFPVPPWDNSAMDGYAVRAADLRAHGAPSWLAVSQRVAIGTVPGALEPGTAARIFTGAPIPEGADAVVMQEDCREMSGRVRIDRLPPPGAHIRRAGEDLGKGAVALPKGRRLSPVDVALAASLGLDGLHVWPRLRVAVLATGDELVRPGQPLGPGRIYASNATLLSALLTALGCEPLPPVLVPDDLAATCQALAGAAADADLVLTSGGVSVGDGDHVKPAVRKLGSLDLWKIAIKPGKPFAFGRVDQTPFLGLPGNPVALFVTFALFAAPAIRRLQGRSDTLPTPIPLPAGFDRDRPHTRDEYLRVRVEGGRLIPHPRQGAGILSSVAWADGLACVPAGRRVAADDPLDFYPREALLG